MKRIFRTRDFQPDLERDIDEELQSHLELAVEDLMARGVGEEEAWARARRGLGDRAAAAAQAAGHTRTRLLRRTFAGHLETLFQDLHHSLRRTVRHAGFTSIALVSLAIGIGASTAVFSLVNAFLIRKAPFRASAELVRIYSNVPDRPYLSSSYPDFQDIRGMEDVFADVGASETDLAVAELGNEPKRVIVEAISTNLFGLMGVDPILGRSFLPEEDREPGEHPVVILGHGLWQQAFGGNREVLGQTLSVAGEAYTVVGVAPPWLGSTALAGLHVDLFVPSSMATRVFGDPDSGYEDRYATQFELEARLAPGVTLDEARARLELLSSQLQEAYPDTNGDRYYTALPRDRVVFGPDLDPKLRMIAVFLLVVVGLVLLLACTNLASFLLARGIQSQGEMVMCLALGADRRRLIRQTLTETLLLGLTGGGVGLVMAYLALSVLLAFQPPIPVSLSLDLGLDWRVFLFALGVSALAGVLVGLAPALRSTRVELAPTLKEGGRGETRQRHRLLNALVGLQIMVSMILLVGGGLFFRSLLEVQTADPGFATDEAGIAWLDLGGSGIPVEEQDQVRVDLEERLRAQPGIRTVTSAARLPLSLGSSLRTFRIPGVEPPLGKEGYRLDWNQVSPGYFEAMEIPILAGRDFTDQDRLGSPPVVVVGEETARRFWPGEDPVGKEIYQGDSETPLTVIGVARDVKTRSLGEPPTPLVYRASAQAHADGLQILVRGPMPAEELTGTLRRVIRDAYPNLIVMEVKTMEQHLSVKLFGTRAAAALLGGLGVVGLLLSTIGLYGVVSFSVSRRTREMGIRMSLGATASQVIATVMKRALGVITVAGAAGLALAWALARLVRGFLVGISPADPVAMVGVPLLLGAVAILAALVPALRAARGDPVEVLRSE